jgi:hypothetical protein
VGAGYVARRSKKKKPPEHVHRELLLVDEQNVLHVEE